jgi:hypothetical protein
MMRSSAEQLRRLYRKEPSSSYRIYKHSGWYDGILDGMRRVTDRFGVDEEAFKEIILDIIDSAGKKETNREQTLEDGFDRKQGYEAFKNRVTS